MVLGSVSASSPLHPGQRPRPFALKFPEVEVRSNAPRVHMNPECRKNEGVQESKGREDISLSSKRTNESPERDAKRRDEGVRGKER